MELTVGFVSLLEEFRDVFNAQSLPIFVELMTGWVLSHRHRFITDLIVSSGSVGKRHFSSYHRFFSQYAWKLDILSKSLFLLLVRVFVPTGVIELAIDDTLARKRGLMVYGTGMHHDPRMSSKAKTITVSRAAAYLNTSRCPWTTMITHKLIVFLWRSTPTNFMTVLLVWKYSG